MIKAVRSSAHTGLSLARSGPRSLFLALACVCFAYGAGESATSDWNCSRLADGAFMGRVSIWWGHEREDANGLEQLDRRLWQRGRLRVHRGHERQVLQCAKPDGWL